VPLESLIHEVINNEKLGMPLESLFGQLASANWITRECAVKTLEAQMRSPDHERWRSRFQHAMFTLLYKDSNKLVRSAARHALEQDYIDRRLLQEKVITMLKEGGPREKARCLPLVPHLFKAPSVVDDLLAGMIDSENANLRKAAVKASAQYAGQTVARPMLRLVADSDSTLSDDAQMAVRPLLADQSERLFGHPADFK
jgi:hypothetical protein